MWEVVRDEDNRCRKYYRAGMNVVLSSSSPG